MKIEFKSSEQLNKELDRGGDITNHGKVKTLLTKDTKVKLTTKNKMSGKRLTVTATDKKGNLAFIPTSTTVNTIARKLLAKKIDENKILAWLMNLELIENEVGKFISMPMGEVSEGVAIADLEDVEDDFVPEDLIA